MDSSPLAPFVERYRPTLLKDVVGNTETIKRLEVISHDGSSPNLILSGPPGTGKTTSIHCLARELLGNSYKAAVLEMNASDDRGIDVVRGKIKMFAHKKVTLPSGRHKLIILDEADSMTVGAQQALRRTMELYSSTTRFALACNTSSKIIEPIQSRCAILRFTRLSNTEVLQRLMEVCARENIACTDKGLEALIFTAEGDMRNALNNLQSTASGFQSVTDANVFKVCDQPHPKAVRGILDHCTQGNIDSACKALMELWRYGYSALDIVTTLFRVTKSMPHSCLSEHNKLEYIKQIGSFHIRIDDGSASLLQLSALCAKLCAIVRCVYST